MPAPLPTVLILGPTAGGKTALSIELAKLLPGGGECICCDSMQVYRGMDIGTAKPTAQEQAQAPHHLLDIAEPSDDDFSVDRWLTLAQKAIGEIRSRGKWPVIVGGTNLYVQALVSGLADMPPPDNALRHRLAGMGASELRSWLERVDPQVAQRIHVNDRKRTIRAIEVFEQTGRPLSSMQGQWEAAERDRSDMPIIIGLDYAVEAINPRINQRVRQMMEAGLLEEVRRLHVGRLLGRNAREALGYKQLIDHLEGRCSLEEAVEQIKIRTRRFAKQQRTWLRRFRSFSKSRWVDAGKNDAQTIANQALTHLLEMASIKPQNAEARGAGVDNRRLTA